MRVRAAVSPELARAAGIVHFVASFGFTLACVVALRSGSRSITERSFSLFGLLYAATAVLAFATFLLSVVRVPKSEIRAHFPNFNWILAAQASFTLQAGIAYAAAQHAHAL